MSSVLTPLFFQRGLLMAGKTHNKFTTVRDQEMDNITNVKLLE